MPAGAHASGGYRYHRLAAGLGAPHEAVFPWVHRLSGVEQHAVVPDHDFADLPVVAITEPLLRGVGPELVEKGFLVI